MKDREYLINFYKASSTDDGKGDIESYESWLERQLLTRIDKISSLEQEFSKVKEERDKYKSLYGEVCENMVILQKDYDDGARKGSEVVQEINSLKEERDRLKEQYAGLMKQYDKLDSEHLIDSLELEDLKEERQRAIEKIHRLGVNHVVPYDVIYEILSTITPKQK